MSQCSPVTVELMEEIREYVEFDAPYFKADHLLERIDSAITALRSPDVAATPSEPVAWREETFGPGKGWYYSEQYWTGAQPLYAGPQPVDPAQSEQEPLEQECFNMLWQWFTERRGAEDMRANATSGGLSADDFKQMLDEHENNLLGALAHPSTNRELLPGEAECDAWVDSLSRPLREAPHD